MKLQSEKAAGVRRQVSGFASSIFLGGALLAIAFPMAGFAREHNSSPRSSGHSSPAVRSNGGSHYSAPSRGQSYVAPREHNYVAPRSSGPAYSSRSYVAPRVYERERPVYRGYYRGGVYIAPYSYGYNSYYDPGYAYVPQPPACTEGGYDAYGNWVPSPNCYAPPQQQFQAAPPNYYPSQQQYQPQQQQYDPNRPPYSR